MTDLLEPAPSEGLHPALKDFVAGEISFNPNITSGHVPPARARRSFAEMKDFCVFSNAIAATQLSGAVPHHLKVLLSLFPSGLGLHLHASCFW